MPGFARNLLALALFLLGATAGCASKEIHFSVQSQLNTNDTRSVMFVVRKVNERAYLTDTYQSVAQRVFASPPDMSILRAEPIIPGVDYEVDVNKPEDGSSLAVYFLFANPGANWKVFIEAPLPDDAEFVLGTNTIESSELD